MSIPSKRKMVSFAEINQHFPTLDKTLWDSADKIFPIRITRSWFSRMKSIAGPLSKQMLPQLGELALDDFLSDPVGEQGLSPVPFVIQKHQNRALLLVSRKCHAYCRFCFRRDYDEGNEPSRLEMENAIAYILEAGVEEVILSGGDPLFVKDEKLFSIIDRLTNKVPTIRIHTRAVITAPFRINESFINELKSRTNIWMIIHCNHPDELNPEVVSALQRIIASGTPILNQTVLLKGINDSPRVLAELFERLVQIQVFPYYLHHPDQAQGTSNFYVSIEEGIQIYTKLTSFVSGIALPRYVIDPPDGTGKIDVIQFQSKLRGECN
jgi:lysine 2,3-aminomutase